MPGVAHMAALKIVVEKERTRRTNQSRFEKYIESLLVETRQKVEAEERSVERGREWLLHYYDAPPSSTPGRSNCALVYDTFAFYLNTWVVQTPVFDGFIFLNIVAVGVATGLNLNGAGKESASMERMLHFVEWMTFWVFIGEAILKIVACGSRPWLYLTSRKDGSFNVFDFALVLVVGVARPHF